MNGQAKPPAPSPRDNPLNRAQFLLLSPDLDHVPPDLGLEVAFAGRSNAGKSSALNALVGQKALARTSKTPGRTQALVFFALDEQRRLVDLPGYGYAKVSASLKAQWSKTLDNFLNQRRALRGLVLVMDSRHPLTAFDQQMLSWCQAQSMPLLILLSKADKLRRAEAQTTLAGINQSLIGLRQVTVQLFSIHEPLWIEQARATVVGWLGLNHQGL
ncbi:MAG: YihA family ribosome biogenesis GTP-binding protein [Gammaproteobacteria bacterium]|nr:YihA family ribosome biogenesis GTP-binding protein [Gammaproteobacteria bacterium]